MTEEMKSLFDALRRVDWRGHGEILAVGFMYVGLVGLALACVALLGTLIAVVAWRLFPWSLLALPAVGCVYGVGWAFLRV